MHPTHYISISHNKGEYFYLYTNHDYCDLPYVSKADQIPSSNRGEF